MEREILRQILSNHYSKDSIKSILSGRMKPSYELMVELNKKHKIPFTAWQNIKSFIEDSLQKEKENS